MAGTASSPVPPPRRHLLVLAVGAAMSFADYKSVVWPAAEAGTKSNPILGFSLAAGHLFNIALGIPVSLGSVLGILLVEGFVVTTLVAAVRLNRYLFEELWTILFKRIPRILKERWVNAAISLKFSTARLFNHLCPDSEFANQTCIRMVSL